MNFFSEVEKAIEREFRKWTEKVFGPAQSDELLVVHRAILEEVESRIQTVQRGRRTFPSNHLRVRLVSPDAARRTLFETALGGQTRRLEQDVRECLAGAGCEIPPRFGVDVETAEGEGKPFEIFYENRIPPAPAGPAKLTVVAGKANGDVFPLEKTRTNIGRKAELTDSMQRVIRRNDVVFEEGAEEVNGTVSRGHAHIRRDAKTGDYRICDDSSEYGTHIFREGRTINVPPGSRLGQRLQPGDEIYLGRACLRFEQQAES